MIPSDTLDRIRELTDIVDLVGKHVELKKAGADFKGRCPFHNEKSPSFSVSSAKQYFHCFGCGASGDVIAFTQKYENLEFVDAVKKLAGPLGIEVKDGNGPRKLDPGNYHYFDPDPDPPAPAPEAAPRRRKRGDAANPAVPALDWDAAVAAVATKDLYDLTGWRGYGLEFAEWLKSEKLIGRIDGKWAIPVHENGVVVRAHIRMEKGWTYTKGSDVNAPLIIGNPALATTTFLFESQWDAFALLDRLDHHESPTYYSAVITRGASSNTDLAEVLKGAPLVIAVPQNDPATKKDKEGKTPAEQWLIRVKKPLPDSLDFRVASTPKEYKDLNDWVLHKNPERREVEEVCITHARSPDIRPFLTIRQLLDYPVEQDPNCVIGRRWLCRGGSMILVGPSGAGKSTLMASMALHMAVGAAWCGVTPVRALRQLIIQAENDDGDIAEMTKGALLGVRHDWSKDQFKLANQNLHFCKITSETGEKFCETLERQIRFHKAEMVWVDPLLSFVGGDISKQDVASEFLRERLNPVLERTGAVICFLHHTGKPSTDSKARATWSNNDFAYLGFGSSEITNWARAVVILSETKEHKTYKMIFAKRGSRAGAKDTRGEHTETIFLRQGRPDEGLTWTQCDEPEEEEPQAKGSKPVEDIRASLNLITWPCRWLDAVRKLREHPLGPKSDTAAKSLLGRAIKSRDIILIEQGMYKLNEFK